jgi:hypothetical protein
MRYIKINLSVIQKLCATALVCLLPMQGFCYGWLEKTQIERLVVHDWGAAVMIYTTTPASTETCNTTRNLLVLLRTNPQFKEIYAAALTATVTKSFISGYTHGCDPGHYNLPLLQRIDVWASP